MVQGPVLQGGGGAAVPRAGPVAGAGSSFHEVARHPQGSSSGQGWLVFSSDVSGQVTFLGPGCTRSLDNQCPQATA